MQKKLQILQKIGGNSKRLKSIKTLYNELAMNCNRFIFCSSKGEVWFIMDFVVTKDNFSRSIWQRFEPQKLLKTDYYLQKITLGSTVFNVKIVFYLNLEMK